MSGLDKIIEHITQEAKSEADSLINNAKEEAQKIISTGKEEALAKAAAISKQSELDISAAAKRIQSASELKEKRIILQAKQDAIEAVFSKALDAIDNMDEKEYFSMIGKMIARYSSGAKGKIRFGKKDLERLPEGTIKIAEEHNLLLDETAANIKNGFVLAYGDIEENCSFDVLIEASREELQDKIGTLLFNKA